MVFSSHLGDEKAYSCSGSDGFVVLQLRANRIGRHSGMNAGQNKLVLNSDLYRCLTFRNEIDDILKTLSAKKM